MDINQSIKYEPEFGICEVPLFWEKAVFAFESQINQDFDQEPEQNGYNWPVERKKQEAVWGEMISLLFIWLGAPLF